MILKRLPLVLALVVVVGFVPPCFAETITYDYDDLYRLTETTHVTSSSTNAMNIDRGGSDDYL